MSLFRTVVVKCFAKLRPIKFTFLNVCFIVSFTGGVKNFSSPNPSQLRCPVACKEGSSEMHSSFCDLQQRKQGTAGHISKIYHQCQFVSCSELVSSFVRVAENFSHCEITTERQLLQAWEVQKCKQRFHRLNWHTCHKPKNIGGPQHDAKLANFWGILKYM